MKYLKTLALFIALLTLVSCDQGFEDFPAETYSMNDENGTKATEHSDSTASGNITIIFDVPEVTDIDYVVTIP